MSESNVPDEGRISISPVLRRNPKGPVYFTPVVDVRVTQTDLRLLSFVVPAADPDEILATDDGYQLPITSQCELILPPSTAEALIGALQAQLDAWKAQQG